MKKFSPHYVGYDRKTKRKVYIPTFGKRVLLGGPLKRARDADVYVARVKERYYHWLKLSRLTPKT